MKKISPSFLLLILGIALVTIFILYGTLKSRTSPSIIASIEEPSSLSLLSSSIPSSQSSLHHREELSSKPPQWFSGLKNRTNALYPSWKKKREEAKEDSPLFLAQPASSPSSFSSASTSSSSLSSSSSSASFSSAQSLFLQGRSTTASTTASSQSTSASAALPDTAGSSLSSPKEQEEALPTEPDAPLPKVHITRSILPYSGGVAITLNVVVNEAISGLIVTETFSTTYTLLSSSPHFSKQTGSTLKWLFYGNQITNQTIRYDLRGEGGLSCRGRWNTTGGSGSITGSATIGGKGA
ncbi:MAG: hypothetical protein WDA18_06875 [Candidatus Ratteibacteria bacterium]|jgi:hypothetical protein